MKRIVVGFAALVLGLAALAPTALAAEPLAHTGRVLISTDGDLAVPAGEQADVVVVISGTATIGGAVNTVVIVDGTANLVAAQVETVVAVRSQVEVGDGTVLGEVKQFDSTVHQLGSAEISGGITDLAAMFLEIGAFLAPALFLLWLGIGLATVVAALAVAGLAARQVREGERLMSDEPIGTFLTGLAGIVLLPVAAVVLFATIIGAPLGFGVLFHALPLIAFIGYVVAAIWVGDWILRRQAAGPDRERPYLAAVIGVVVLGVVEMVPILGLAVVIASLAGFGAVLRLGIQALRGTSRERSGAVRPMAAPTQA